MELGLTEFFEALCLEKMKLILPCTEDDTCGFSEKLKSISEGLLSLATGILKLASSAVLEGVSHVVFHGPEKSLEVE